MLSNKKIVIVGGSSGIGLEVARKLLALGANVVIASRSAEKLAAAQAELGLNVAIEVVDAVDPASVHALVARVGQIDHLIMTIKPKLPSGLFLESDVNLVKAAFDAKFWGQYNLAKNFAKQIATNGSIIFTSGVASLRTFPGYSIVAAMNAATEALTKALAVELSPIRVNAVCPGFVDTTPPSAARAAYVTKLAPQLPLNRLGVATEIAETYIYLLTSMYSSGSVVVIDGGVTC